MWVIYGRLQIDIWTVDHRCDRITYNPLWMWTSYPDFDRFMTIDVMDELSRFSKVDHPKRGHLSPCELYIAPFGVFWDYVIRSFLSLSLSLFIWSHLSLLILISYFDFELWSCSCYLLCNIWWIGTELYFTQETEEDQAFQTFEPTDEPEWDGGDGFGAVWTNTRENVILEFLDELSFSIETSFRNFIIMQF